MKKGVANKTEPAKKKYVVHKYTVIKFVDDDHGKLFECIPDVWFEDDTQTHCFFPPTTGKPYIQRAINCERPDDNWGVYECTIVKGGFLTYNAGFKLVKEKCSQPYNTSSAEEEQIAAEFRRQHPGLVGLNFENVFAKPQETVHSSVMNEKTDNPNAIEDVDNETAIDCAKVSKKSDKQPLSVEPTMDANKTTIGISGNSRCKENAPSSNSDSTRSRPINERSIHSVDCAKVQKKSDKQPPSVEPTVDAIKTTVAISANSVKEKVPPRSSNSTRSRPINERSIHSVDRRSKSRRRSVRRSESFDSKNGRDSRSMSSVVSSHHSRSIDRRSSTHSEIARKSRRIDTDRRIDSRSLSRVSSHRSRSIDRRSSSHIEMVRKPGRIARDRRSDSRSLSSTLSSRHSRSIERRSRSHSEMARKTGCTGTDRLSVSRLSSLSTHSFRQLKSRSGTFRRSKSPPPNRSRTNNEKKVKCLQPKKFKDSRLHSNAKFNDFSRRRSRSRSVQSKESYSNSSRHQSARNSFRSQQSKMITHERLKETQNQRSRPKDRSTSPSNSRINSLITSVNALTEAVKKNNAQTDRRLTRLEVTVNKIFLTLGDMNGHNLAHDIDDLDFDGPDLPIASQTELFMINRKLKDKEFRRVWLNNERNFCCPTKTSTDTRTITKYLKRFISLRVRCQFTLKEQSGESGYTLYRDYKHVYEFLIDIMKEGYRICGKKITRDEAHTALRVVWGRSKQLYSGKQRKK